MAGRVVSKYYSEIIWRQNQTSVNNIKKSTANIAKSLENTRINSAARVAKAEAKYINDTESKLRQVYQNEKNRTNELLRLKQSLINTSVKSKTTSTGLGAGIGATTPPPQTNIPRQPRQPRTSADSDARKQAQFEERRLKAVEALEYRLRSVNGIEKETLLNQIRQVKTQDELNRAKATTRMRAAQILDAQRQIEREMNKQNFLQERMNGSILQMAGGFVSAYTALEGMKRVINTGINWEGIQRSFEVISSEQVDPNAKQEVKDAARAKALKAAGDEMNYVAVQARKLGLPLQEAQRGYMSLVAAMNTKLPSNEIRTIFEGINEAGVALGVGEEGIQRITLAVKQMALI